MEKNFLPNGPAYLSRASHQRCGPAASRTARPRCVRGSSRRKPAGRCRNPPAHGAARPVPRERGPGARHTAAYAFGLRTRIRVGHGEPWQRPDV